MKNTFGQSITITLFGESHGAGVGSVIDGLGSGIDVDENFLAELLKKRRPSSNIDTPRQEKDKYQILSGVFNGKTTGSPITIVIPNEDTRSSDYNYGVARPSHADYAASIKYNGFEDYRGGGHFSGRITTAIVAVGGILIPALEKLGIKIATHISSCADIKDRQFENIEEDIKVLNKKNFPILDDKIEEEITSYILKACEEGDSVGGIVQTIIYGIPAGLGEPWFDSVESLISHAMFSLGGIKGIEFGKGFDFANLKGSQANDSFAIENGKVITKTNNNGGINGGITNGMPILFNCVVKPTSSISKEQDTINFKTFENMKLLLKGRHDPAIIRRICPVINSMAAFVIADLLVQKFGTDIFTKGDIK